MQNDTKGSAALAAVPERLLHADPHDFAGLYIRHRSSLTLHARRHLNDVRDADEVVQEAFLRLFLALPELGTEPQALAYCRRTITNLCIDRYRADARRPNLVDLDSVPQEKFADDDPGDPVVRAEDAALVREALAMLPELHRAALVKREVEEKPLPVIADELDIPEDNVKHLLFRARRALRKMLAGTSLAPGVDVERGRGVPRVRSGGVAGLLVLLLVGLGSGPDLEAVPVVGVDLPDVLGVTRVTEAVVEAVTDAVSGLTSGGQESQGAVGRPEPLPAELAPGSSTTSGDPAAAPAGAVAERQDAAGERTPAAETATTAGAAPAGPAPGTAEERGTPDAAAAPAAPPVLTVGQRPAVDGPAAPRQPDDQPRGAAAGSPALPATDRLAAQPRPVERKVAAVARPERAAVPAPAGRERGASQERGPRQVVVETRGKSPAKPASAAKAAPAPAHATARVEQAPVRSAAKAPGPVAVQGQQAQARLDPAPDVQAQQVRAAAKAEASAAREQAKAEAQQAKAEAQQAKAEAQQAKAEAQQAKSRKPRAQTPPATAVVGETTVEPVLP